jgi:hypothetical protein
MEMNWAVLSPRRAVILMWVMLDVVCDSRHDRARMIHVKYDREIGVRTIAAYSCSVYCRTLDGSGEFVAVSRAEPSRSWSTQVLSGYHLSVRLCVIDTIA